MKKAIKIVLINLLVLIILLVGLELILRIAGKDSIHEKELKVKSWGKKYKIICDRILKERSIAYDSFYTDDTGLFKANRNFYSNPANRSTDVIINSQGFRGNEFVPADTPKTKILLVGDSFTWGAAAVPLTESFADLVQRAGYHVYNAGIPGTDLVQYERVAAKYTPALKPDVVAVCLYLGNDLKKYPHPLLPNKNLHYTTNFGMLNGFDDQGKYFKNAQQAFAYLENRKCGHCTGLWERFIYKTVIGSAIYKLLNKNRLTFYQNKEWIPQALKRIERICKENNSRFMLFLLPVVKRNEKKHNSMKEHAHLFSGFTYYLPANLQTSDYEKPPRNHFINSGHRKYADFIIETLTKEGFPPQSKVK